MIFFLKHNGRHIKFIFLMFCFVLFPVQKIHGQIDSLRIASYNLLKFPSAEGPVRIEHFRKVIQAMAPDILVVQEIESEAAVLTFLSQVMNADQNIYQAAPFIDGPDTDNALFYNQNKIRLLGPINIPTSVRDINGYVLLAFDQEFTIFSVHLKAGSSTSDQQIRLNQTTLLRNHLNGLSPNSSFMVVGDYNMRSASEAAFLKLTESQVDNDGRLFDPINQIGEWHNNSIFILTHTQSTRTTSLGGGATGGLDDRFDMMLVSDAMRSGGGVDIMPATYKAFGNDGDHFNLAINAGTNFSVPDSVADALHQASDHLPVVADFVFEFPTSVNGQNQKPVSFSLKQNFPNPFNPETTIKFLLANSSFVTLTVFNLLGQEVAALVDEFKTPGEYQVNFNGKELSSGIYVYKLSGGGKSVSKKLLLLK